MSHKPLTELEMRIDEEANNYVGDSPVHSVRELNNYIERQEDVDAELRIHFESNLAEVFSVIQSSPNWTVRHFGTTDSMQEWAAHIALIFHTPDDVSGQLFFDAEYSVENEP